MEDKLIPAMLNKIREIRNYYRKNLDVDIEVDGGIKAGGLFYNVPMLVPIVLSQVVECLLTNIKEGCDDLRKVAQEAQRGMFLQNLNNILD